MIACSRCISSSTVERPADSAKAICRSIFLTVASEAAFCFLDAFSNAAPARSASSDAPTHSLIVSTTFPIALLTVLNPGIEFCKAALTLSKLLIKATNPRAKAPTPVANNAILNIFNAPDSRLLSRLVN